MSGVSIGHPHPRPCTGKKTLRRCSNNEGANNVILIDVDSENFDNVVIVDIPDSLPKKNKELCMLNKNENWSFRNVINIDDDETPETSRPFGVNNVSFAAGTSLNRESFRVASKFGESADSSDDDCQFVQDGATPVRLSKCKRTYSGKASTRNCYGLDTDSDCDISDNDYPDCELVEDVSGKVQELWEKAFSKRKKDIHYIYSGSSRGHESTSHCINKDHQNVAYKSSSETKVNTGRSFSGENHSVDLETATGNVEKRENSECSQSHTTRGPKEMESSVPERHSDKDTNFTSTPSSKAVDGSGKYFSSRSFLSSGEGKKGVNRENGALIPESPLFGSIHLNEAKHKEDNSLSDISDTIINEREKLKETDEYKRAIEEEWASRQEVLRLQAEEAKNQKRLRKRKKAESMRLLDMERRQKERLEEVRNIQKKDAENTNLKEVIRAEVRNTLNKLEVGCQNMAFLLHLLGVQVDNWPNPSSQEVQSAYRRALLTFHPDRASRSDDIRKLVEAEEKFKLINRVKEKFPPL